MLSGIVTTLLGCHALVPRYIHILVTMSQDFNPKALDFIVDVTFDFRTVPSLLLGSSKISKMSYIVNAF